MANLDCCCFAVVFSLQITSLAGVQRPQLESEQTAAVEAEDFDTAAALDEQLRTLQQQQQQLTAQQSQLERSIHEAAEARLDAVRLRAQLLGRLGSFFEQLQQQRHEEMEAMNQAAEEVIAGVVLWEQLDYFLRT